MNEYVIYFEDGSYFKCFADSKSDALSYLHIERPYVTKEDIQSISVYQCKY